MARSQKNNDLTSQEVTLVLLKKLSEELFDDIDLEQVCECADDLHKMAEAFVYSQIFKHHLDAIDAEEEEKPAPVLRLV